MEEGDAGICRGSGLWRRVRGGDGNLVRGLQRREYLLATLAIRDVRFQGRHLFRGERPLVIRSEGFRVEACTVQAAFGAARAQMTREASSKLRSRLSDGIRPSFFRTLRFAFLALGVHGFLLSRLGRFAWLSGRSVSKSMGASSAAYSKHRAISPSLGPAPATGTRSPLLP